MGTRMYCCSDMANTCLKLLNTMTAGNSCTAHYRRCLCMFLRCTVRNNHLWPHKSTPRCKYSFLLSSIQRQSNLENIYCIAGKQMPSTYPHTGCIFPLHSLCTPDYRLRFCIFHERKPCMYQGRRYIHRRKCRHRWRTRKNALDTRCNSQKTSYP